MKKYIGKKEINAVHMNRLEYNNLRGWKLPEDENGTDEGYLVEYIDGGKLIIRITKDTYPGLLKMCLKGLIEFVKAHWIDYISNTMNLWTSIISSYYSLAVRTLKI